MSLPAEALRQIHQAAAFGVGGQARFDGVADIGAQSPVGLKLIHEHFGEAAADDEAIDLGQRLHVQGVDVDQFDVGRTQGVDIFAVIKTESLVVRDADTQPLGRRWLIGRERQH